jgi:hypothetical protein
MDLGFVERLINVLRATSSDFCPNIRRAVLEELLNLDREAGATNAKPRGEYSPSWRAARSNQQ